MSFVALERQLTTFPLLPIVNGRCVCRKPKCDAVGKHPAVESVNALTSGQQVPIPEGYGRGIATGYRSGIFVVDIDSPEANELFNELGECPETLTIKTPRGWHLYFEWPGFQVVTKAPFFGKGIDIRGDGGIVVAPGSPHKSGGTYSVLEDLPVAKAPAWMLAWPDIRRVVRPKTIALTPVPVPEPDSPYGRSRIGAAARYLQSAPLSIERQGGRTTAFAVCVMLMRRMRLPVDIAIEVFDAVYNPRLIAAGTTTWSLDEIRERLESAANDGEIPIGDVFDEFTFNELNLSLEASSP